MRGRNHVDRRETDRQTGGQGKTNPTPQNFVCGGYNNMELFTPVPLHVHGDPLKYQNTLMLSFL